MGTITLSASTTPAVAALAQVLWNALDATTIQTGSPGGIWPFSPDSLNFSALGTCKIDINGDTGQVAFSFAAPQSPTIRGTLDLALLEAQLTTAPNVLDYDNPSALGPAGSVQFTTSSFTRQKSGDVFLTAQFNGTQSAQDNVTAALYRDYGTPGQVDLNTWALTPGGGIGTNLWAGHIHDVDQLPDELPHTWTLIMTGSSGSNLSLLQGDGNVLAFELGGPG